MSKKLADQELTVDDSKALLMEQIENIELEDSIGKAVVKKNNNKKIIISLVSIIAFLVFIAFLIIFSLYEYYHINSQDRSLNTKEQSYLSFINKMINFSDKLIGNQDTFTVNLSFGNDIDNGFDYINSEINSFISDNSNSYVNKKQKLGIFVSDMMNNYTTLNNSINEVKDDASTYGYSSKEINKLLLDNSIQRSIISVESIKLYTAMKTFSQIDEFLELLASSLGYSVEDVKRQMDYFISKGDKDIGVYLQYCFLNPLENDSCTAIGDFETYYLNQLAAENPNFTEQQLVNYQSEKINVFKKMIEKIQEYSKDRFSIVLNSIDTDKKTISFTIEVQTYSEDEKSLSAIPGITNPHLYIVANMINLLRESHYILGEGLNIDEIAVSKRTIASDIGYNEVKYSNFSFDIPIQEQYTREIFDVKY